MVVGTIGKNRRRVTLSTAARAVVALIAVSMLVGQFGGPRPAAASGQPFGVPAGIERAAPRQSRRVVAYFPTFVRDDGYTENDIDFSIVTVVAHWSVSPRADGSLALPSHFPDPALVAKTHAAGAKIVLVVGDDQATTAQAFSTIVASAGLRQTLVANLMQLVRQNGYDGIDIDWEYPQSQPDSDGLTALATQLRAALGPSRTLSLATAPGDWSAHYVDVTALAPLLDWFGLMTYQYAGPAWSQTAQHNAPLYATAQQNLSVDATVAYFRGRGVAAAHLLIGLPFFGERYDGAGSLYAPLANGSGADLTYRAIAALPAAQWTAQRDTTAGVPYLLRADGTPGVITFDDPTSIAAKCRYAVAQQLGGAIIWRLGQDGVGAPATQPLLQAARACR